MDTKKLLGKIGKEDFQKLGYWITENLNRNLGTRIFRFKYGSPFCQP